MCIIVRLSKTYLIVINTQKENYHTQRAPLVLLPKLSEMHNLGSTE